MQKRELRFVFLDPDGSSSPWIGVVIEAQTCVVYATQCAGTNTELRLIEGYFIPLGGAKINPEAGQIDPLGLSALFHRAGSGSYGGSVDVLPGERMEQLRRTVATIPCWATFLPGQAEDRREALQIDDARLNQLCEAWVPVVTANGHGVLLWSNCD